MEQQGNFSQMVQPNQQAQGYQTGYSQQQQPRRPNAGALGQYLNQMNYVNNYNQNILQQQQSQMEQQNMQMNQLMLEQDHLQRQLGMQRQLAQQARKKAEAPSSRQKEMDALALLNNFQKTLNTEKGGDPFSIFDNPRGNDRETPRRDYRDRDRRPPSYNDFPVSRGKQLSRGQFNGGDPYYDQVGYPYNQGMGQSPFQSAANMLINPMTPGQYPGYNFDPYTGQPIGGGYGQEMQMQSPQPRNKEGGKTAEILMSSLEKQNQILAELTGSINKDRDYRVVQEAKEIENKIKQLEFESQAKQHQLYNQNTLDILSQNYNRPIPDINLQRQNELLPGMTPNLMSPQQMFQLQNLFGNGRGHGMFPGMMPPTVAVMPSELMQHQQKLRDKKDEQKKKEKKKKNKLKELLLLLGVDEDEEEEEPNQNSRMDDSRAPKRDKPKKKKNNDEDRAAAEQRAREEEERRRLEELARKEKNKRRCMALMWARLYPILFYVDFYEKKGVEREAAYAALNERIAQSFESAKTWATKHGSKGFDLLLGNAKQNLAIVPFGGKKITPKDSDARVTEIHKILKTLVDGLVNNVKEGVLSEDLIAFLGDISNDYAYPPQSFLFPFEVARLSFTHTASLKDTTPVKVQMVCAFFMLIRVLLGDLILQPSKVNEKVALTDMVYRNIKTVASILMIIITDLLRSRVLIQNNNQNHLDTEVKIKARSQPIPFVPPMDLKDEGGEEGEEGTKKKKDDADVPISGLYSKEQLAPFFSKKPFVDEIKALIEGWCNAIEPLVSNKYKERHKDKLSKK